MLFFSFINFFSFYRTRHKLQRAACVLRSETYPYPRASSTITSFCLHFITRNFSEFYSPPFQLPPFISFLTGPLQSMSMENIFHLHLNCDIQFTRQQITGVTFYSGGISSYLCRPPQGISRYILVSSKPFRIKSYDLFLAVAVNACNSTRLRFQ